MDKSRDYIIISEGAEKTAILSVADHEYNTDGNGDGVSIFSSYRTYLQIAKLSQEAMYVIVIYHSGYENAVYPSPDLMDRCRAMVESGASAVLCQHSHCIGAYEVYQDSLILYGQGNSMFDLTYRDTWHQGLCVCFDIVASGLSFHFEPVIVRGGCVIDASDEERQKVLASFEARSKEIHDPKVVAEKWTHFLKSEVWKYNAMLMGGSKLAYIICKALSFVSHRLHLSRKQMTTYLLFMRSDTHREAIVDLLQMERRKKS